MKKIIMFFALLLPFCVSAQDIDCDSICVLNITLSSTPGFLDVTVYNGNSEHINYPTYIVLDANGETIANPQGSFDLFAQSAGTTITQSLATSLTELPENFTGTVLVIDQVWNDTCSFSYPMECSVITQEVNCGHLLVVDIQTGDAVMNITVFNSCDNCATGEGGPVYCEMRVIRTVAPFDTIAASNCYCLFTPPENGSLTYPLQIMSLPDPAPGEFRIEFIACCDNLTIADPLSATGNNDKSILKIFPNPGSGRIFFNNTEETINAINVFDAAGRLINTTTVATGIADLTFLPAGIYFLQVISKNKSLITPYIKTE